MGGAACACSGCAAPARSKAASRSTARRPFESGRSLFAPCLSSRVITSSVRGLPPAAAQCRGAQPSSGDLQERGC